MCYYADATVQDSVFEDNKYACYFLGYHLDKDWHPTHTIKNVTVKGADYYALMSYYGDANLTDCTFEDNKYGVYLHSYHKDKDWHATHTVKNITVKGTKSTWSFRSHYADASLTDCTFEDNRYGIYMAGWAGRSDWHPTYSIDNLKMTGTKGSWTLYTYRAETTLRNSTFENCSHGVTFGDSPSVCDKDRIQCVAENLTIKNNSGWAFHTWYVDADVKDITAEKKRYCVYFYDYLGNRGGDKRCQINAERLRVTGCDRYWGLLSYRCDLSLVDSQIMDNANGIYMHEYDNAAGTGAQAYLDRVEIRGNKNSWGLLNYRTDIDMRNCLVAYNKYGIYMYDMDKGSRLWHVSSVNNWAHGIYNRQGHVDVYNCVSTGSAQGYGLINYRGTMNNDNNLVVGNYRNYWTKPSPGIGSVTDNPEFGGDEDYHLTSSSAGVNRGRDPGDLCPQDLEKYDRGQDGGWNIGCYATTAPSTNYDDLVHAYTENKPISWWRLGEKVGEESAVDIKGGVNGIYSGGVQRAAISPVSTDGCAFFATSDQYIRVPHNSKFMLDDGTVLLWYRMKEIPRSWSGIFSKKKPGTAAGNVSFWTYKPYNGRPYVYDESASQYLPLYSGDPGTLGEWTFLAYTFGSGGATSYENGAMVLRRSNSSENWNTDANGNGGNLEPIYIGGTTWSQKDKPDKWWPFVGWIDEVALFDRQLSAGEISKIYKAALNPIQDPDDMQIPPMWGVTGTDGNLLRVDDYTDLANTTTDFGPIQWKNGTSVEAIGNKINSIGVESGATAYLLVSKDLGSKKAPLVMRLGLQDAEDGNELIATAMGTIDVSGGVNDIAVDPGSGLLYALGANGRLYSFDPVTGSVITDFGKLKNDSRGLKVDNGKALMFDQVGAMYVLDAQDNHLYRVDKNTALIRRVPDYQYGGGLEAAAWDHLNNQAVASNTSNNTLRHLTLIPGNNPSLGSFSGAGLSNVTGLSFVPNEGRGNTSGGWRMTEWIEIR